MPLLSRLSPLSFVSTSTKKTRTLLEHEFSVVCLGFVIMICTSFCNYVPITPFFSFFGLQVDVFSFGIVLWEILTGEEPYANMHYGAIIGENI